MSHRFLLMLLIFGMLVAVVADPAVAQDTVSDGPVALTPHGDPDIQGIFTFRTLTLLEHTARSGNPLHLVRKTSKLLWFTCSVSRSFFREASLQAMS